MADSTTPIEIAGQPRLGKLGAGQEPGEGSVTAPSGDNDAKARPGLDPGRLFPCRSQGAVDAVKAHPRAFGDPQAGDLAGKHTVALGAFAKQAVRVQRGQQVTGAGDNERVGGVLDLDDTRLLPITVGECIGH